MPELPRPKRLTCAICKRPQRACICCWVTRIEHEVEVLILQHPLEATQAKGSARLLHLCLPRSQVVTGEVFNGQALYEPQKQDILLYPVNPPGDTSELDTPAVLQLEEAVPSLNAAAGPSNKTPSVRLVVLDATWRKSRKMLYLNPWLQRLPRLSLTDVPASRYLIRKAHTAGQLSTLEATCAALAQLEANEMKYAPLLQAFDGFVGHQAAMACRTIGGQPSAKSVG